MTIQCLPNLDTLLHWNVKERGRGNTSLEGEGKTALAISLCKIFENTYVGKSHALFQWFINIKNKFTWK